MICTLELGAITLNPERFQFRANASASGTTGRLSSVRVWREELSGVLAVWLSPADCETYLCNGHHRYALAARLGVETLTCRIGARVQRIDWITSALPVAVR